MGIVTANATHAAFSVLCFFLYDSVHNLFNMYHLTARSFQPTQVRPVANHRTARPLEGHVEVSEIYSISIR